MAHHALDPAGEAGTRAVVSTEAEAAARLEAGRRLFAGTCEFFHGAQRLDQLPPGGRAEIAFAGRSNVGKSSLLNALTGRRALARVSNTPGRTRQLNFFNLGDRLTLVDMPGYGYARAGREIQADWQGMMFDYLRGRPELRRVLLLLDSRVPLKDSDHAVMALLDRAAVTFQLVLTKVDGLSPPALLAREVATAALAREHPAAHPQPLATSAETGVGVEALRAELAGLVPGVG